MADPTSEPFQLRKIAIPAYGPTAVSSLGYGALAPVVALRARDLGADVSTAALVVSLFAIGMLICSLPSGVIVARLGERRTLFFGGLVDAAAMVGAYLADSVTAFAIAMVVSGMAWTSFLIARQQFMIEAVPVAYRARALATLGGTFRIGTFLGPLIGAGLIAIWGLSSVLLFAGATSVAAGLIAMTMPDFGRERRAAEKDSGRPTLWSVLRAHRRVLLTLGVGVVVIGVSRSMRASLLPLWADHIGVSASTTSLVFALAAALDIAMFYPGGWVMDRHGRRFVAVPIVLGVGIACLLLPLVHNVATLAALTAFISLANGLGSGIVMTLGADAAPSVGTSQFLGGWRLCGDIGNTGGPLLVSSIAAVAPLAAAAAVIGVLCLVGSAWVGYWTREVDRERAVAQAQGALSR